MKTNQEGVAELIIVAAVATIFLGGTATVVVSDSSKPGDVLYSVDRSVESVQEKLAFTEQLKTEFKFSQATERLEELEALETTDAEPELVDEASNNYGVAISEAAERLAELAKNGGDINEALASLVTEATTVHLDTLAKVHEKAPEQARESIQKAMTSSETGTEKSLEALNGSVTEEKQQEIQEKIHSSRELRGQPTERPAEIQQQGDTRPERDTAELDTPNPRR